MDEADSIVIIFQLKLLLPDAGVPRRSNPAFSMTKVVHWRPDVREHIRDLYDAKDVYRSHSLSADIDPGSLKCLGWKIISLLVASTRRTARARWFLRLQGIFWISASTPQRRMIWNCREDISLILFDVEIERQERHICAFCWERNEKSCSSKETWRVHNTLYLLVVAYWELWSYWYTRLMHIHLAMEGQVSLLVDELACPPDSESLVCWKLREASELCLHVCWKMKNTA